MGLDTQLVLDGTYFVVECDGEIAGCGGWSWRSTLYGGDDSLVSREPEALDPATDAARIRAMYTDPGFTRRGVGRLVLRLCEDAARSAGFRRATMMATMAGVPLYRAADMQRQIRQSWPGSTASKCRSSGWKRFSTKARDGECRRLAPLVPEVGL